MKTIAIVIIVALPPVSLTAKKMFPKKSHCYNLINNLAKSIVVVYYYEWCSLHTIISNLFLSSCWSLLH